MERTSLNQFDIINIPIINVNMLELFPMFVASKPMRNRLKEQFGCEGHRCGVAGTMVVGGKG